MKFLICTGNVSLPGQWKLESSCRLDMKLTMRWRRQWMLQYAVGNHFEKRPQGRLMTYTVILSWMLGRWFLRIKGEWNWLRISLMIRLSIRGFQPVGCDTTVLVSEADDLHSGNHVRDWKLRISVFKLSRPVFVPFVICLQGKTIAHCVCSICAEAVCVALCVWGRRLRQSEKFSEQIKEMC
jgi:hypothetical protein